MSNDCKGFTNDRRNDSMKHNCSEDTAAICGLFCGICPAFPEMCDGFLSDRVLPFCAECGAGFRKCAEEHCVKRCSECPDSPCERLIRFNADEYEHHHIVLENNARNKCAIIPVLNAVKSSSGNAIPVRTAVTRRQGEYKRYGGILQKQSRRCHRWSAWHW